MIQSPLTWSIIIIIIKKKKKLKLKTTKDLAFSLMKFQFSVKFKKIFLLLFFLMIEVREPFFETLVLTRRFDIWSDSSFYLQALYDKPVPTNRSEHSVLPSLTNILASPLPINWD